MCLSYFLLLFLWSQSQTVLIVLTFLCVCFVSLLFCFHAARLFHLHTTSALAGSICQATATSIYGEHKKIKKRSAFPVTYTPRFTAHLTNTANKKKKEGGVFVLEFRVHQFSAWNVLFIHVRVSHRLHTPPAELKTCRSVCLHSCTSVCVACVCFVCVSAHWIRLH